jgi:hypothetical protein
MIEYLYNAIRARANAEITIGAAITDEQGNILTEGCNLTIFAPDKEEVLFSLSGVYNEETQEWGFIIPAEKTQGLDGRYWYCISYFNTPLCFKEPIYFV